MSFPVVGSTPAPILQVLLSYPIPRPAILCEDYGGVLSSVSEGMTQQIGVGRLHSTSFPFPY